MRLDADGSPVAPPLPVDTRRPRSSASTPPDGSTDRCSSRASIAGGTRWTVFEPNDEPLWSKLRRSVDAFLTTHWRLGAFQGVKAEEAYFVRCDRTTMTQADIDAGRVIVLVGFAPLKPAEFVVLRIQLRAASSDTDP